MELIVIVAEFVVGDFAFGAAANLNVTSQAVRAETLPTVYETLCLDRFNPKTYLLKKRKKVNAALEHTKYFCLERLPVIAN
jgi:hypothetical protein